MKRRTIHCEHFTGIGTDVCRSGVKYDDVSLGKGTPQFSLPCLIGATKNYNQLGASCGDCMMPTLEEIESEEREMRESMDRTMKARDAIVNHLGGPWKRGTPGAQGRIDCPACGQPHALAFSRSSCNGHIHARCSTPNCCAWME